VPKSLDLTQNVTDPVGKTLYAQPMRGNGLYTYDLMAKGDTISGGALGTLVPSTESIDCCTMYSGPTGTVWCTVTKNIDGIYLLHVVCSIPGDKAAVDLRAVEVRNPDFMKFTDQNGEWLPTHGGFVQLDNGKTIRRPRQGPNCRRIPREKVLF